MNIGLGTIKKIIGNTSGHGFEIGDLVLIIRKQYDYFYCFKRETREEYRVHKNDIGLVYEPDENGLVQI